MGEGEGRREGTDGVISRGKSWETSITLYWRERDTKTITSLYRSQAVPARPSESSRVKIKTWDGVLNMDCGF